MLHVSNQLTIDNANSLSKLSFILPSNLLSSNFNLFIRYLFVSKYNMYIISYLSCVICTWYKIEATSNTALSLLHYIIRHTSYI